MTATSEAHHEASAPEPNELLRRLARGQDCLTHVEWVSAQAGVVAEWPAWAPDRLRAKFAARGITAPWSHQAEAASLAFGGAHVVVATGTGSGKSMAYQLPVLTSLLESPKPTALYLAPTKALAADQLRALEALGFGALGFGALGSGASGSEVSGSEVSGSEAPGSEAPGAAEPAHVRAATLDGDTPYEEREWARAHGRLILTNPDLIHHWLLPRHKSWSSFLRRLRYVVIDECHTYRGVFGSHVAHVIRRLRRICARYGASPVFILASATVGDPAAAASRLIGLPTTAVSEDGSPRGGVTFALWEPPLVAIDGDLDDPAGESWDAAATAATPDDRNGDDADRVVEWSRDRGRGLVRKSAPRQTADLLADSITHGARTLAFVRSRRGAEVVAAMAKRALAEAAPHLADRVAAYRAGYLREERRWLEQALLDGSLLGVASTNALELGVDLVGLDAVLLSGYPGTLASMWQQAGRAGRAGRDALCVLVARDDPLDTYLVHHPEALFQRPVEATVLDPTNPYVLGPHLCAAAAELPLTVADLPLFGGECASAALETLVAEGALRRRPTGWYWAHSVRPAVDLRGSGDLPISIVEASTGRLLGTVDTPSAHVAVHAGAVHLHQGASYVVDALDLDDGVALVHEEEPGWTTHARDVTSLTVESVTSVVDAGPVGLFLGAVDVTNQVVSYQRRRLTTGEVIDTRPLDLPMRQLQTTAVWWTVSLRALASAGVDAADVPGALHAAEHASIGLLPLIATCDRWDIGGLSTAFHADTEAPTVFVYDGHQGGAGFAERAYQVASQWLSATRDAIAACGCDRGCPSCVQSPKCGNGNEPLAKADAVKVLDVVLSHLPAPA